MKNKYHAVPGFILSVAIQMCQIKNKCKLGLGSQVDWPTTSISHTVVFMPQGL